MFSRSFHIILQNKNAISAEKMKLSVIIPVYCVESTLDRCVESVLAQDIAEMEVILVDDGSPDRSPTICDKWAAKDSRIYVIHKQNGGLSDARNAGINVAQGEYITFVDSDDFIAPDTYAPLMEVFGKHDDTDLLEFPILWHYGAPEQRRLRFGDRTYERMSDYWLEGKAYTHSFACNKIFRRKLFQEIRFPVGQVFEDMATLPLLLQNARKVMTSSHGMYYYCQNPESITATATGHELNMLLRHHLKALPLACDTCYYMHVVNIQLDVCRLLNVAPELPPYPVSIFAKGLTWKQRLKAIGISLLGIKNLSKLYRHER